MSAEQMIRVLEALNMDSVATDAFAQTADAFGELNKEQLAAGDLRDGGEITNIISGYPGYSSTYGDFRARAGLQVDHVDLKVTGAFYGGYQAVKNGNSIDMNSPVSYEDNIERLYGPNIWGLTPENLGKFSFDVFFPVLKERIEVATTMKFV